MRAASAGLLRMPQYRRPPLGSYALSAGAGFCAMHTPSQTPAPRTGQRKTIGQKIDKDTKYALGDYRLRRDSKHIYALSIASSNKGGRVGSGVTDADWDRNVGPASAQGSRGATLYTPPSGGGDGSLVVCRAPATGEGFRTR